MTDQPIYLVHHIPKTGGVSLWRWLATHLGMYEGMVHYGVVGETLVRDHGLPYLEELPQSVRDGVRVVIGHYVTAATADLFPGREARHIVVLREPVKRLISQYNHAMDFWCRRAGRPQIGFEEWFEKRAVRRYDYRDAIRRDGVTPETALLSQASLGPNFMGRLLALNFGQDDWIALETDAFVERVNGLLDTFWRVGITERLADLANALAHELGIPADVGHVNRGEERPLYLEPDDALLAYIRAKNPADIAIYAHWKAKAEAAAA